MSTQTPNTTETKRRAPISRTMITLTVLAALAGISGLTHAGDLSPLSELNSWRGQIAEQWGEALGAGALTF